VFDAFEHKIVQIVFQRIAGELQTEGAVFVGNMANGIPDFGRVMLIYT
jgi:hypothetical protein